MIQRGDTFTIAGVYETMLNPQRRWWQFWKPKIVPNYRKLREFKVL